MFSGVIRTAINSLQWESLANVAINAFNNTTIITTSTHQGDMSWIIW